MPGIFGIIRKNSENKAACEQILKGMLAQLSHNENYVSQIGYSDWFGLGNIGLPIAGEQRFLMDENRGVAAAFSGYIYGWKGVPAYLSSATPDKADRLNDIYKHYGKEMAQKIDGSFNAVVFDQKTKEAILCNDRFGHRQLYYYEDDELFLFSTEIKAFRAYDKFDRGLDMDGVADYFNIGYPLGDKTFFRKVKILPGARIVSFRNGKINFEKYWDYKFEEGSNPSLAGLIEEIDTIYPEIVKKQTAGAKDVIIPLSGGLDSRFILSHAVRAGLEPYAFTHGRNNCHDHRIAFQVAQQLGIKKYRFIEIDPLWLSKYSEKYIFLTEGMISAAPASLLAISACYGLRPDSTILLNGIFGGPTNFGSSYFKPEEITSGLNLDEKLRRLKFSLGCDFLGDDYYNSFSPDISCLLKKQVMPSIANEFAKHEKISPLFCNQKDIFFIKNRLVRYMDMVDCNRYLWHDHFSLADDCLVDFYQKLPPHYKPGRIFMIEYFKAKLPQMARIEYQSTGVNLYQQPSPWKIKYRQYSTKLMHYAERITQGRISFYDLKRYSHPDQNYRSHRQNRDYFESILLDDRTYRRGYFNRPHVEFLLRQESQGANNFGLLDSLLSFELFNRLFID
jgi:hypothetical protein